MTILPLEPGAASSRAALGKFLAGCRADAALDGRRRLVSISVEVEPLDPLAVLEAIFEPDERHFYVERAEEQVAIAGAEAVVGFAASGPGRFAACQRFIDETLADAVVVGDPSLPFAGPHFFSAFSFFDQVGPGEPFEAAGVFVPRWQVARRAERSVAVANLVVDASSSVETLTEKVWRAHAKFRSFDFRSVEFGADRPISTVSVREVGDEHGYEGAVRRAAGRIARGDFDKVVLARAKDACADHPFHPLLLLNGLRQRFPDCFAFSVANGRGQSFIGASPERLLRVESGVMLTEALAGSIRRGASASEDAALAAQLLRSEKDLREQRMVLDSMVRRLAPLGLKLEFPARPALRRFANVQHLHTPVQAALPPGTRLLEILGRLHPTPAVGGTPREAAVPCIAELEGFPRGLYAGALGWIDFRGNGEFSVGLRSALVAGAGARLYAGAGIVAGSQPEKEFAETELKFKAIQDALIAR